MSQFFSAATRYLLALLFFASVALPCEAQTSPEITRGLQWLAAQVQADGSLVSEPQSIATKLQARTEAAQTLKLLASLPSSLATGIGADTEDNTEYLARKTISLGLNGWDTTNYVNQLIQQQNVDGGLGGAIAYASNTTDTAWTVLALAQANKAASDAANRARAYLTTQIAADGGIVARGDINRLHQSALALLALQTTPTGGNATAVRNLASWILQQQGADGSWAGNQYLSAFALAAIAPVTADATVRGNARNFLLSKQMQDGSWNGDPFLTALALRSLSIQFVATPTIAGILKGQLKDLASNAPLSGVSVTLTGAGSQTATTDETGSFTISGLSSGTYTAAYARNGYSSTNASYTINAGQTTDAGIVGLTQLPTGGIIRGLITSASGNVPLAGVGISIAGAATLRTVSDAAGRYELIGVAPGTITITASLTGYQTASGNGAVVAGQTVIFSPTLYANGQTAPTTIRYTGTVVSAGQAVPLAGVALSIAGASTASATTTATGQFDVTLIPGSYSATFTLAGYGTVKQTFVAPAGTTVAAGVVTLSPIKTASTVKGQVLTASNAGISGALVQVVGTTIVATTAADGSYTLNNLVGTSLSIRASATGYNSQTMNLQLSAPGDFAQNFILSAQSTGALSIGELAVSPATVGSGTDIAVNTFVANSGAVAGTAILRLQVLDKDRKVIGTGITYDANGNLLGQINLAAGQQQNIKLIWNSGQFSAGTYVLDVQLLETGSITQGTPQGNLIVERAASVSVTAQSHFTGAIASNPPVLQAGTNTAVKLSAIIKNDGNTDIPAQSFTLTVINTNDGSVALTQQASAALVPVNGLQTLALSDWTPTAGGNFRMELTAADLTLGKIVGTLYVGDAAKAAYTVDKLVVPTGTQTVRGAIKVTGQDVTTGVISDPLAPLIKTAVGKAVAYNYVTAAYDTTSARCNRCHVQSQALVGGELTRTLTNYSSFTSSRDIILNELTTHQQANGAIDDFGGYQRTQSMLGLWALNTWHKKDEVLVTLAKGGDYLVNTQAGDGHWDPDHASGWWSTAVANTAFNVKSLAEIYQALKQAPATTPVKYTATPWVSQGISGPYHLTGDAQGNVYVSNYNSGTISLVKPDGTTQPFMTGLQNPTALAFAGDGTAYASSYAGLYRRNADGTATQITSRHGSGLAIGPTGNLYMSSYWDNKIFQITPAGVASDYIVGGLLSSPWGIAFSTANDLVVANYGNQTIVRYKPTLAGDVVVTLVPGNPYALQANGSGWLVTTASGLYAYSDEWHGQRLIYSNLGGATATPDGTIVVGDVGANTLYKVVGAPVTAAALSGMDASIAKGATWLLQDGNTDGNNNLSLAQRLIGLNAAKLYYKGQPLADTLQTKMVTVGAQLRARVNADGGWGWYGGYGSDSLVTAQVGVALDALNPSASDPIVQNAVKLLLNRQHADGTWYSENGILGTALATTTWVSIWLPTVLDRLGGVDTDLSVTFPANVTMTNPDLASTSSAVNGDGTKTYVWKMQGVTNAGRTINYDLSLADMLLDEVRPVSTDAHLTFKNSFTGGVINAPIDVPRVKASAFLGLGITTNKLTYPADTNVGILGQVTNTGANLSSGKVKFDIYAADKTLVATVGSVPFSGVAAGASVNVGISWNTGQTLAGAGYYALGTLYDSADRQVGTAQAVFAISAPDNATALTAKLTTDKQTYLPSDVVKLNDRLTNLTVNTLFNDVRLVTTVKNPDGTILFTKTEVLPQLSQGNLKDYTYSVPLNFAPAGLYSATLTVTAADGAPLAQSSTQFTVGTTAVSGSGLRGTIAATPKQVPLGDAVVLSFSANNVGNSALVNLPLKVSIVDPAAQKILAEFPYVQSLNTGATYNAATTWQTTGAAGTTYVAILTGSIGGKTLTLAQDSFVLIPPPIKLDIKQTFSNGARVLVLVSCSDGENDADLSGGKPAVCVTDRSTTIDQTLTALGVSHTIVTNTTAFTLAMRSGIYNTYWISGKQDKLHDDLASEVREAVYGGDGLILDGVHDQRNKVLDTAAGYIYGGKIGETDLKAEIAGPLFAAQTLQTAGRATRLELSGSAQQATLYGSKGDVAGPAIITHTYGANRAVTFTFDLVKSLQAQSLWQPVLGTGLQYVMPGNPVTITPGSLLSIKTSVANLAKAVDVDVKSMMPQTAVYMGSNPTGNLDTGINTIDWAFNLAEAQTKDLFLTLRVPPAAGDYTVQTIVSTIRNGASTVYGPPLALQINVVAATQTAANATQKLTALVLTQSKDQKLRDSLVADLQQAMALFNQNTAAGYAAAIGKLVQVIDGLSGLTTVDTAPVHYELDRILKEAQWRWAKVQPQ